MVIFLNLYKIEMSNALSNGTIVNVLERSVRVVFASESPFDCCNAAVSIRKLCAITINLR